MVSIKLIKKSISLIITPFNNVDFNIGEIIDNSLLDEVELDMNSNILTYDLISNKKIDIDVSNLTDNHILMLNGKLFKIVNMFEDYK